MNPRSMTIGRGIGTKGLFWAWIYCLWLAASPLSFAGDEEQLKAKVQDLEERLKRLEAQQSQSPKPSSEAPAQDAKTVEVEELRRQVDVLASEVEKLRSGEPQIDITEEKARTLGLGPSAANVYRKTRGLSLAGYGEMLYENFDSRTQRGSSANKGSQLDFLRAVLYAGYSFNDKFVFNSEIELEHANEISVEFAYVDYRAHPSLNFRGGLLLVPMGLINEFHEPNVFLGARRTEVESQLIPTTWRENGFGIFGSAGMFSYRAYLVNGLDAGRFASDGLRGGRQKGSRSKAADFAFVGRLDVTPTPGVFFGGSLYRGGSDQDQFTVDGRKLDVMTTIGELHGQAQVRGFDIRGLYARAVLDDVARLNAARKLTGNTGIGERMQGGYVQIGYNLLSQFKEEMRITPYYRFEKLNTQDGVAPGFQADPARDRRFHTFGFEFRPVYNIVVKTDYQWNRNEAKNGLDQFNIGLGYSF